MRTIRAAEGRITMLKRLPRFRHVFQLAPMLLTLSVDALRYLRVTAHLTAERMGSNSDLYERISSNGRRPPLSSSGKGNGMKWTRHLLQRSWRAWENGIGANWEAASKS